MKYTFRETIRVKGGIFYKIIKKIDHKIVSLMREVLKKPCRKQVKTEYFNILD